MHDILSKRIEIPVDGQVRPPVSTYPLIPTLQLQIKLTTHTKEEEQEAIDTKINASHKNSGPTEGITISWIYICDRRRIIIKKQGVTGVSANDNFDFNLSTFTRWKCTVD